MKSLSSSRAGRSFFYLLFLLLVSIGFNVIYNWDFLQSWSVHGGRLISENALISTLMLLSLFLVLSVHQVLFAVAVFVIFILSAVVSHFMHQFKIMPFSAQTIAFAMETNTDEALGHVGTDLMVTVLLGIALSTVIVLLNRRFGKQELRSKMKFILVLGSLSAILGVTREFPSPLPLPFGIAEAGLVYCQENRNFKALARSKRDISTEFTLAQGKNEELVVVLIIGESARADHFHINGYHRQTTPNAESLGLTSFADVRACGTSTRESVPCLMTRATLEDKSLALRETSLVSIFRKADFYTAWISNHRVLGEADTPVTSISREADFVYFGNKRGEFIYSRLLDEDLLPVMDSVLQDPNPRKLIVLHTVGSHWHYEQHYTEPFRKYTPTCDGKTPRSCTEEELFNSYDNTILYTDHFIGEVIRRMEPLRALVVYVSDHGESLGEGGRFMHGQGGDFPEQIQVPFLVWISEKYAVENPGKVERLRANAQKPVSHDHVFHSALDIAGFESDLLNLDMSIFHQTDRGCPDSLVAQGVDGIESRSTACGEVAENHADGGRKKERQQIDGGIEEVGDAHEARQEDAGAGGQGNAQESPKA